MMKNLERMECFCAIYAGNSYTSVVVVVVFSAQAFFLLYCYCYVVTI